MGERLIVTTLGVASPSGANVTPVEPALASVTLPLKFTAVASIRPPPSSSSVPAVSVKVPTPKGPPASTPPETVLLALACSSSGPARSSPPLKLLPVIPSDRVPPCQTTVSAQQAVGLKASRPGPL